MNVVKIIRLEYKFGSRVPLVCKIQMHIFVFEYLSVELGHRGGIVVKVLCNKS
jgi:hypothetical protein